MGYLASFLWWNLPYINNLCLTDLCSQSNLRTDPARGQAALVQECHVEGIPQLSISLSIFTYLPIQVSIYLSLKPIYLPTYRSIYLAHSGDPAGDYTNPLITIYTYM